MGAKSSKVKPTSEKKETTVIPVAPAQSLERSGPVIVSTNSDTNVTRMLHSGLKITGGKNMKIITIKGMKAPSI
jgi:hypothetical protein